MTYNSKKNITSMVAGILSVAAYVIYVCTGNSPETGDIQAWAILMLIFIGVGAAMQIVVQVVFHIAFALRVAVKEHDKEGANAKKIMSATMIEDERDKLINLKSLRIGYICTGAGLVVALLVLAAGLPFVIALHIVVGSCAVGSFVEGCAGIFFNERGVRNG